MDIKNPYYLFVAGEPSGDRLGESLVKQGTAQGLRCMGSGGPWMQAQGLETIIPFYDMGVSGFLDVLPRIFTLRKHLQALLSALENPLCKALVCIDYPGFNIRLFKHAKQLGKPVFWVAPPQIWAWKSKRGKIFEGQLVHVLFPFEAKPYLDAGASVVQVAHPLLDCAQVSEINSTARHIAILPGSRIAQANRNLPMMLKLAKLACHKGEAIVVLTSNAEVAQQICARFKNVEIRNICNEATAFDDVRCAICGPGTASLDLALRDIPTMVVSRIDVLTYCIGRLLLKIPSFVLPNLLLQENWMPEHLVPALLGIPSASSLHTWVNEWKNCSTENAKARSASLRMVLTGPSLCGEFSQFIQRNT